MTIRSTHSAGAPDRVYVFTPTATGEYTITLEPDFDANLYVTTSCPNAGTECLGASETSPSFSSARSP